MSINHRHTNSQGISINILLLVSFAIIAFVPVTILGVKVYDAAWDNAWREVREKHQLLAENLSAPIEQYVMSHQTSLALTAHLIIELKIDITKNSKKLEKTITDNLVYTKGFKSILLLDAKNNIITQVNSSRSNQKPALSHFGQPLFLERARRTNQSTVSSIVENPYSGRPSIYIAEPMSSETGTVSQYLLLGELDIAPIEKLRQGIRFGTGGHSAIVDNKGIIIAHPNPAWMNEKIVDLSNLKIVQYMMAGETGVTEFYSPFKKHDMVAGYTSVPELGWGIMVPQPKWEVQAQVRNILFSQFGWALVGLALALIAAHYLGRWITQPLNELARAGNYLAKEDFQHNLPKLRDSAPTEIIQLSNAFSDAIEGLSVSRAEVEQLNKSLQFKINEATTELRQANTKLSALARMDHLTKLSNRRHFEQTIANLTTRRQTDNPNVCLLLIDVDHFKGINDKFGHAAGDMALIQVAEVLDRNTRQTDLAARYAGDEFILLIRADVEIGRQRAAQIRTEVANQQLNFDGHAITVTVSIGLFTFDLTQRDNNLENILRKVDTAMYEAKRSGRNTVAEVFV